MRLAFLVLVGAIGAGPAFADQAVRTGAAAFGDWRTDAPGARRLITPADLPAPYTTASTANMSQHAARHSGRAERRYFRRRNRSGAGAGLSPKRRPSPSARRDLR